MTTLLLACLAVGVLIAGLMRLSYLVGKLDGIREANRVAQATWEGGDEETTGIQCRGCLKAVAACTCPGVRRGRA